MPPAAIATLDRMQGVPSGGIINGDGQSLVLSGGRPLAVVGCTVQAHAGHVPPIAMQQGSAFVAIAGKPVCRAGDLASCGHLATGSAFLMIGR
jgi:uncharacterized Zn-binding protein involved in type VI secretion